MATHQFVKVVRRDTGQVLVESARWCATRWCRLWGFMFRRQLAPGEALVMPTNAIHMFFVFCSLAAVWIDERGRVTSVQLAKPWRPYYASTRPARYVLEAEPSLLGRVQEGDELDFEPLSAKPAV